VCTRAFARAPHIQYFFQGGNRRWSDAEAFFRLRIRYGLLFGEVYTPSPDLEGLAVWLPAKRASMTAWREVLAGGMRLYRTVGADAVARMIRLSRHNEQLRHQVMPARHWMLSILAVDPKHQRKGLASALIGPMLARLDRERIPCYAETTEAALLPFYERQGFRAGASSTVPGTGLEVWPLVHAIVGR
jgi:GNAT superfamily N-acetyltransferase